MKTKNKYIQCSCGGELISLEKWDGGIYLSIWERGYRDNNKLTFFERLLWCWKIIKSGRAFGDCIILDDNKVDELIESLEELKNEK